MSSRMRRAAAQRMAVHMPREGAGTCFWKGEEGEGEGGGSQCGVEGGKKGLRPPFRLTLDLRERRCLEASLVTAWYQPPTYPQPTIASPLH